MRFFPRVCIWESACIVHRPSFLRQKSRRALSSFSFFIHRHRASLLDFSPSFYHLLITMSDDEQHNHNFEQVNFTHCLPLPFIAPAFCLCPSDLVLLISCLHLILTGQCRGLYHLPHAMLGPPQKRSRRDQGYVAYRAFGPKHYSHAPAGRPCKIVDMSTSKTGKHGHAKVHLVGIDVRSFFVSFGSVLSLNDSPTPVDLHW